MLKRGGPPTAETETVLAQRHLFRYNSARAEASNVLSGRSTCLNRAQVTTYTFVALLRELLLRNRPSDHATPVTLQTRT